MKINQKIPEGWSVKKLSDLCSKISDGIHTTPKYVDKSEYHFINGNNLRDGHIYIYENTKCVSFEEYTKQKQELGTRTLLMSINGTIGSLANYCNEDVVLGKSAAFMNFNDMQTKKYVYTILQTNSTKRYFENELTGSTIKNLLLKSIKNMKLLLPPLAEQEKIVGILGTWDEAIEKLSSLIEQKKLLKKGLMQKLLTGKTRLPTFTQPWKEVKLEEIAEFYNGYAFKSETYIDNGLYKIITIANVQQGNLVFNQVNTILELPADIQPKQILSIGDIIFSMTGNVGRVCLVTTNNCLLNQRVGKIIEKGITKSFLYHLLSTNQFIRKMESLAQGGAQDNLSLKDVKKYKLFIPSDITEQKAIADVLSTADDEINLLNKKLEALKEQKKGLMQQLLTGQTRVKVN